MRGRPPPRPATHAHAYCVSLALHAVPAIIARRPRALRARARALTAAAARRPASLPPLHPAAAGRAPRRRPGPKPRRAALCYAPQQPPQTYRQHHGHLLRRPVTGAAALTMRAPVNGPAPLETARPAARGPGPGHGPRIPCRPRAPRPARPPAPLTTHPPGPLMTCP
jgi:hypothetical protein